MKLFTEREIRAAAIFLPLALLALAGIWLVRPKHDPTAALEAERREERQRRDSLTPKRFDPNTVSYEELRYPDRHSLTIDDDGALFTVSMTINIQQPTNNDQQ